MFKLLYKIGEIKKSPSKLEIVDKSGQEKEIQKFFEKHLESVFPKLKLFVFEEQGETTTKYRFKKGDIKGELDAICWYPEGRFFIIFEYKSEKPGLIMEQILKYSGAFCISEGYGKLFDDLNIYFPKSDGTSWKYSEIEWDKSRVAWISPELPSYFKITSVIWIKSEWYENNGEKIVRLESEDSENLLEKFTKLLHKNIFCLL